MLDNYIHGAHVSKYSATSYICPSFLFGLFIRTFFIEKYLVYKCTTMQDKWFLQHRTNYATIFISGNIF